MDYIESITKVFSSLTGVMALVALVVLWKTGLLEFLLNFKKSGKNGNGNAKEHFEDIKHQLTALMDNHIEHVERGIDELKQIQSQQNIMLAKMLYILEEIKDKIIR